MKTLNYKKTNEFFAEFALTNVEMTKVRGGDAGEPVLIPPIPPVKI